MHAGLINKSHQEGVEGGHGGFRYCGFLVDMSVWVLEAAPPCMQLVQYNVEVHERFKAAGVC